MLARVRRCPCATSVLQGMVVSAHDLRAGDDLPFLNPTLIEEPR